MCGVILRCVFRVVLGLVGIIGLKFIVVGGLIYAADGFLDNFIPSDKIKDAVEQATKALPDTFPKEYLDVDGALASIPALLGPLGEYMIYIGVVIMAFCIAGIVFSCFNMVMTWILYIVVLTSMATVLMFVSIGLDKFKEMGMYAAIDEFGGLADKGIWSMTFNGAMVYLGCCGVHNYKDFKNLSSWPPKEFDFQAFLPDVSFSAEDIASAQALAQSALNASLSQSVNASTAASLPGGLPALPGGLPALPGGLPALPGGFSPALLGLVSGGAKPDFKTPIACCKDMAKGVPQGCFLKGTASEKNNNLYIGCYSKLKAKLDEVNLDVYIKVMLYCIAGLLVGLSAMAWVIMMSPI